MSRCHICDQKFMNCDCTPCEKTLYDELEEMKERAEAAEARVKELEDRAAVLKEWIEERDQARQEAEAELFRLRAVCDLGRSAFASVSERRATAAEARVKELEAENESLRGELEMQASLRNADAENLGDWIEGCKKAETERDRYREQAEALAAFVDENPEGRGWCMGCGREYCDTDVRGHRNDCAVRILADRIRRERAEAWDEGHRQGWEDAVPRIGSRPRRPRLCWVGNPYRDGADDE